MDIQNDNKKMSRFLQQGKYWNTVYSKYKLLILKYSIIMLLAIYFIDFNNYPTQLINRIGVAPSLFFGMLLFSLFIIFVLEKHLFDWMKIISINILDCLLQVVICSSVGYLFAMLFLLSIEPYKLIVVGILVLVSLFLSLKRGSSYISAQKKSETYKTNIIDLKDLHDNKISSPGETLWLDERDVDYDLLNRKSIINHLVNIILSSKPQGKFVISLEGKWGSGKTTILKNVKNKIEESDESIIVIDDFDPWTYGTEESIVENFFRCVMKKNNLNLNTLEFKQSIKVLINAVVDSPQRTSLLHSLIMGREDVNESKSQINEYLKLCGKRIVIYMDNLDRVEDDKIVFIFKLIGNVLNFDRVTYVLAFDDEKIKNVFDDQLNIDYDYIKKIVQMQIKVPEVNKDRIEGVIKVCTTNLIALYEKSQKELGEYNEFINYVSKNILDIRDFKRTINSIVVKSLNTKSYLSKRDKLIIDFIRMNNHNLYRAIYENPKYFVSEDTIYMANIWGVSFDRKIFNKEGKDFFEKLFDDSYNYEYKEMLKALFPYVNKYIENQELKSEYSFGDNSQYRIIAKSRGIASAKYFDLYFSDTENQISMVGEYIEGLIDRINESSENVSAQIDKMFEFIQPPLHKELFEGMQLYISDINNTSALELLRSLFKNIWEVDNSYAFLRLNAQKRCNIIMWELLQKISEDEYESFLKEIKSQYDKLIIIDSISYWFKNDDKSINIADKLERWNNLEKEMISDILDKDIDLYADVYYHKDNILALLSNLGKESEEVKDYIKNRMNRKNIYRIIYDTVGYSVGSGYQYYIHPDYLKGFFYEEKLKEFMENIKAETEDEEFIMQLYRNHLQYPNDIRGNRTGIVFNKEKILNI